VVIRRRVARLSTLACQQLSRRVAKVVVDQRVVRRGRVEVVVEGQAAAGQVQAVQAVGSMAVLAGLKRVAGPGSSRASRAGRARAGLIRAGRASRAGLMRALPGRAAGSRASMQEGL
jgi:hypothetical protein